MEGPVRTLLLLNLFLLSCAPHNFPDGLDKNDVPSEQEVGRNEVMDIPESEERPLIRDPLEERNPEY